MTPVDSRKPTRMTHRRTRLPRTTSDTVMDDGDATKSNVNSTALYNSIRIFGFLIGLLAVSFDLWGHILLFSTDVQHYRVVFRIGITIAWAMLSATVLCTMFFAVCRMMEVLAVRPADKEKVVRMMEEHGLKWAVVGTTIGYALVDAYFLPMKLWCVSVAVVLGGIVLFKLAMKLTVCLRSKIQETDDCGDFDHEVEGGYERLVIV